MKTIGQKIKEIRIKLKLTQSEFATILGYNYKIVSNWENGRNTPTTHTLKKSTKYLGLNMKKCLILMFNINAEKYF